LRGGHRGSLTLSEIRWRENVTEACSSVVLEAAEALVEPAAVDGGNPSVHTENSKPEEAVPPEAMAVAQVAA